MSLLHLTALVFFLLFLEATRTMDWLGFSPIRIKINVKNFQAKYSEIQLNLLRTNI